MPRRPAGSCRIGLTGRGSHHSQPHRAFPSAETEHKHGPRRKRSSFLAGVARGPAVEGRLSPSDGTPSAFACYHT